MVDFFLLPASANSVWIVILLTGVVTYFTRSAGYIVLARFKNLHPRLEAALEAVPGAVLVTLILPAILNNGLLELFAMIVALLASFRLSAIGVLLIGMAIVILGRMAGL
ncbi:MAG: AzlD domain-containing protein [Pseudomonadota bacterium]